MAKKQSGYDKVMAGLQAAADFANGTADANEYRIHVPAEVDVKAIRKRLGFSQQEFAARFGFNVARVRDWEQRRCQPDGALRAYLLVIDRRPKAVEEALAA